MLLEAALAGLILIPIRCPCTTCAQDGKQQQLLALCPGIETKWAWKPLEAAGQWWRRLKSWDIFLLGRRQTTGELLGFWGFFASYETELLLFIITIYLCQLSLDLSLWLAYETAASLDNALLFLCLNEMVLYCLM